MSEKKTIIFVAKKIDETENAQEFLDSISDTLLDSITTQVQINEAYRTTIMFFVTDFSGLQIINFYELLLQLKIRKLLQYIKLVVEDTSEAVIQRRKQHAPWLFAHPGLFSLHVGIPIYNGHIDQQPYQYLIYKCAGFQCFQLSSVQEIPNKENDTIYQSFQRDMCHINLMIPTKINEIIPLISLLPTFNFKVELAEGNHISDFIPSYRYPDLELGCIGFQQYNANLCKFRSTCEIQDQTLNLLNTKILDSELISELSKVNFLSVPFHFKQYADELQAEQKALCQEKIKLLIEQSFAFKLPNQVLCFFQQNYAYNNDFSRYVSLNVITDGSRTGKSTFQQAIYYFALIMKDIPHVPALINNSQATDQQNLYEYQNTLDDQMTNPLKDFVLNQNLKHLFGVTDFTKTDSIAKLITCNLQDAFQYQQSISKVSQSFKIILSNQIALKSNIQKHLKQIQIDTFSRDYEFFLNFAKFGSGIEQTQLANDIKIQTNIFEQSKKLVEKLIDPTYITFELKKLFSFKIDDKNNYNLDLNKQPLLMMIDEVCMRTQIKMLERKLWLEKLFNDATNDKQNSIKEAIIEEIKHTNIDECNKKICIQFINTANIKQLIMLANPMTHFQRPETIIDLLMLPREQLLKMMINGFQFQGLEAIAYRDLLYYFSMDVTNKNMKYMLTQQQSVQAMFNAIGLQCKDAEKEDQTNTYDNILKSLKVVFMLAGTYTALGNFFTSSAAHQSSSNSRYNNIGTTIHSNFLQLPQMHPQKLNQKYYLFGLDSNEFESKTIKIIIGKTQAEIRELFAMLLQALAPGQSNYLQTICSSISPQLLIFDHSMQCFYSKSQNTYLNLKHKVLNKIFPPAYEHNLLIARICNKNVQDLSIYWGQKNITISLHSTNELIKIQPLVQSNFVVIGLVIGNMINKIKENRKELKFQNALTELELFGTYSEYEERVFILFMLFSFLDCFVGNEKEKQESSLFIETIVNVEQPIAQNQACLKQFPLNLNDHLFHINKQQNKTSNEFFKSNEIYITALQPEFFLYNPMKEKLHIQLKTEYFDKQVENAQIMADFVFQSNKEIKIVIIATILDKNDMLQCLTGGQKIKTKIVDHFISFHIQNDSIEKAKQCFNFERLNKYEVQRKIYESYLIQIEAGPLNKTDMEQKVELFQRPSSAYNIYTTINFEKKVKLMNIDYFEKASLQKKSQVIQLFYCSEILISKQIDIFYSVELLRRVLFSLQFINADKNSRDINIVHNLVQHYVKQRINKNIQRYEATELVYVSDYKIPCDLNLNSKQLTQNLHIKIEIIHNIDKKYELYNSFSLKITISNVEHMVKQGSTIEIYMEKPQLGLILQPSWQYIFPVKQMIFNLSQQHLELIKAANQINKFQTIQFQLQKKRDFLKLKVKKNQRDQLLLELKKNQFISKKREFFLRLYQKNIHQKLYMVVLNAKLKIQQSPFRKQFLVYNTIYIGKTAFEQLKSRQDFIVLESALKIVQIKLQVKQTLTQLKIQLYIHSQILKKCSSQKKIMKISLLVISLIVALLVYQWNQK